MKKWLIFTDLDGTLLDHVDYSFNQALPSLEKIKQLQIPLIINSSKTYAEIKSIRQQLHNNSAFAVENGAVIFLPDGDLSGDSSSFKQHILGKPYADILKIIHSLRDQKGFLFKGFSDYSINELMLETGLAKTKTIQAKQRLASEPLKWMDSEEKLREFEKEINSSNLQLIQGGRFLHVMGQNDKSQAMAWMLNRFKLNNEQANTIAMGDSQNDRKMLEQADFSGVIRKVDGSYMKIDKNPEQVIYSQQPAPLGWQEVIDQLFKKLNIGEFNE